MSSPPRATAGDTDRLLAGNLFTQRRQQAVEGFAGRPPLAVLGLSISAGSGVRFEEFNRGLDGDEDHVLPSELVSVGTQQERLDPGDGIGAEFRDPRAGGVHGAAEYRFEQPAGLASEFRVSRLEGATNVPSVITQSERGL